MKQTLFFLVIFASIFLFSCEEVGDAKSVAEEFYTFRQSQDYEKVLTTLSDDIYEFVTEEQIISDLKAIDKEMGEMNSFKSNSFNIATNNGETTATFTYKVVYDKGVMIDSIALIKEANGYKIFYYYWKKQ